MIKRINVGLGERAILSVDEIPTAYMKPGVHWILKPYKSVSIETLNTQRLIAALSEEQLALVPAEDLRVLKLEEYERAVVKLRGTPVKWLGPGEHQIWTVARVTARAKDSEGKEASAVDIEVIDTSSVEAEPLTPQVRELAPDGDYVERIVPHGATALRYVDGVLDRVLGPGRHAVWTTKRSVQLAVMDLRERLLAITGQEVMTKDRVSLRLNLTATYKVADPARLVSVARDPDDVLYLAVQLAAREAVSGRSLDELLALRDALSGDIADEVRSRAEAIGLRVISLALKDVVLPGEMKTLLNKVIEAQKQAEANVIMRREEAASTRTMAQNAKVLDDSPTLQRLKELEAYTEMAGKIGQLNVVLGEGVVPTLRMGGS